jgi:hypothetical protein
LKRSPISSRVGQAPMLGRDAIGPIPARERLRPRGDPEPFEEEPLRRHRRDRRARAPPRRGRGPRNRHGRSGPPSRRIERVDAPSHAPAPPGTCRRATASRHSPRRPPRRRRVAMRAPTCPATASAAAETSTDRPRPCPPTRWARRRERVPGARARRSSRSPSAPIMRSAQPSPVRRNCRIGSASRNSLATTKRGRSGSPSIRRAMRAMRPRAASACRARSGARPRPDAPAGRRGTRHAPRRAQDVGHQRAPARPELGQGEGRGRALVEPGLREAEADQLAEHLADLGRGGEVAARAQRIAGGVVAVDGMGQAFRHVVGHGERPRAGGCGRGEAAQARSRAPPRERSGEAGPREHRQRQDLAHGQPRLAQPDHMAPGVAGRDVLRIGLPEASTKTRAAP